VDSDVDVREMLAVAERAIAVFERVGDDVGLSRAWSHVAQVHWTRCRCAEMEEVLEKALVHAERAGDRRERSRILSGLARAAVIGPRPVEDGIRRCNAILERAGDDITLTAVSEAILAVLEAMQGRFEPARERWRGCRRRLEEVGLTVSLAGLQMYCALVELLAGQPEAAEREAMEAYAVLERIGEHWRRPTTAAILARALCAQGRYEEAERFTRIAEGTASKDDVVTHVIWRAARAQALARTGDPRVAEELAASSVALAAQTDFLLLHADALVAHADVLAVLDRPREAAQRLDRAVALYECKCVVVPAVGVRS
jgi:hypothetical protein